jgi:glycosyltransferase involved in cell wall biosynthesis
MTDRMVRASRKPRLLIVSDSLAAGLGGVVLTQVEWFVQRGWDVHVSGQRDERSVELPVGATDIGLPVSLRTMPEALLAVRNLRRLYGTYKPDIVHCHGIRSWLIAALAGRRPIMHLHGVGPIPSDPRGYHKLRQIALGVLPRLAVGAVSASPGLGDRWLFQADVSPKLDSMRRLPFPPGGEPTFLWLGRLAEKKRPDLFIQALAQVGKVKPVRGVIAGEGDLERTRELRALADRLGAPVVFLGERTDVGDLLRGAWVFVLLTRFEGMPLAVEEAMWAGRAIVASKIPPLEWLVDGAGFLVEGFPDLVDVLLDLTDASLAERYGQAAADRIRAVLPPGTGWDVSGELYESRLKKLAR